MFYEKRMRTLAFWRKKKKVRGDLIALYHFLRKETRERGASLFFKITDDWMHEMAHRCAIECSDWILG